MWLSAVEQAALQGLKSTFQLSTTDVICRHLPLRGRS